jgi:hypothetical protein
MVFAALPGGEGRRLTPVLPSVSYESSGRFMNCEVNDAKEENRAVCMGAPGAANARFNSESKEFIKPAIPLE